MSTFIRQAGRNNTARTEKNKHTKTHKIKALTNTNSYGWLMASAAKCLSMQPQRKLALSLLVFFKWRPAKSMWKQKFWPSVHLKPLKILNPKLDWIITSSTPTTVPSFVEIGLTGTAPHITAFFCGQCNEWDRKCYMWKYDTPVFAIFYVRFHKDKLWYPHLINEKTIGLWNIRHCYYVLACVWIFSCKYFLYNL